MGLLDQPARELLDRFASSDPTPGGGSAAALAGALGAALVSMVCAMPKTKNGTAEERSRLDATLADVQRVAATLRQLVDDDTTAYDGVVAAYRLAKSTDADKAVRKAAILAAMVRATEVPTHTAELCAAVLRAAAAALECGNPNAASDARTGAALAWAGLVGAAANVKANASSAGESGETMARRAESLLAANRPGVDALLGFQS